MLETTFPITSCINWLSSPLKKRVALLHL